MSALPYLYGAHVALLTALALIVVGSRRPLRFRLAGLAVAAVALAAGHAGLADALSRPKPAAWEFAAGGAEDYEVLYTELQQGRAIHLLLRVPGVSEPRLYAFPWSPVAVEDLSRARDSAEAERLMLRADANLFESDIEDRERIFYAAPVAALPLKDQRRFDPAPFVPTEDTTMYGAGEPDG